MVIINPNIASQPAALNRPAGPAPVIPIDRILVATVLGERAQHLYELAAGNLRLMAESQTPLRSGEELRLTVLGKDTQQRPVLQVLNTPQPAISQQLRQTLPVQQPINQTVATLIQLLTTTPNTDTAKLLKAFLQALPSSAQLSDSDQLRQSILRSGLFREQQLLATATSHAKTPDLKSALLKLADQLQQSLKNQAPQNQAVPPDQKSDAGQNAAKVTTSYAPQLYSALRANSSNSGQVNGSAGTATQTSPPPPPTALSRNQQPTTDRMPLPYTTASNGDDLPGVLKALSQLAPQHDDLNANATLTRLISELRGAVARIESHQLLHLQGRDHQQGQYLVELPVRHDEQIDIWQLQIQWQRGGSSNSPDDQGKAEPNAERVWSITLNFDLPGLGEIRARVRQQAEELHLDLTIAETSTHDLFRQHAKDLLERIVAQGAPAPSLQLQCAQPATGHSSDLTNTHFVAVTA